MFRWSRFWPLPVSALSYLTHLRLRRALPYHVGRRHLIPELTSLRLAEIYMLGGLAASAEMETQGNIRRLLDDPVLLDLQAFALGVRMSWVRYRRDLVRKGEELPAPFLREGVRMSTYPADGSSVARLNWYYHYVWSGPPAFNAAAIILDKCMKNSGPPHMSPEDRYVYTAHLANTLDSTNYTFLVRFKF